MNAYYVYDEDEIDFNMTDEQAVMQNMMRSYSRYSRPVMNASHAVIVKLGITLNQIFDVVSGFSNRFTLRLKYDTRAPSHMASM